MRLANLDGRAIAIAADGRYVDLAKWSDGRLPSDPMAMIGHLGYLPTDFPIPADAPKADIESLGPPIPRPSKILGVAVNYPNHADEMSIATDAEPEVFAMLPSSLVGAHDQIRLQATTGVDWEAELVVVIGKAGRNIAEADAWDHIAGVTCGQDISDRPAQFRGLAQFTLGKSNDTYSPIGPWLVTTDEFANPDDIGVSCLLNGVQVQTGRTSQCFFSVPQLIAYLSKAFTFEVGDLLFTGTPPGVGWARDPQRFLSDGDVLETVIEGIGSMRNVCVEAVRV